MRADWYSATCSEGADEVVAALLKSADLASVEPTRGLHSYERGVQLRRGDRTLCSVFWGGVNGDGCHVQATGPNAPWLLSAIRASFPQHRVSRFDACEDYTAPNAWDWLSGVLLEVADRHRLKVSHQGDWHRGFDGRSLYLGGRAARVQVVGYEKGKQLQREPDWVRVEVRVKPQGEGKAALATAQPAELLGCSRWTTTLAERLGTAAANRISVRDPWNESDDERAMRWLARQYAGALARTQLELGGWCALGNYLGSLVEEAERNAAGKKA